MGILNTPNLTFPIRVTLTAHDSVQGN